MKKIKFLPHGEKVYSIFPKPDPAIKNLPDWFKKMSPKIEKHLDFLPPSKKIDANTNFTVKMCTPFQDALSSGYFIFLPADVFVTKNEEYQYRLNWSVSYSMIEEHSETQIPGVNPPEGYEKSPYKWINYWGIELPKGYSYLVTHPLNRWDLPFLTLSAVVDGDSFYKPVHFPFYLKEDFEGFIPKGTPIAQIIPIKREKWISKIMEYDIKSQFLIDDLKSIAVRSYKKRWWKRKEYV